MTKKQTRERNRAWNLAISEGRVLRFEGGAFARAYPTKAQADAALARALSDGLTVNRVPSELAVFAHPQTDPNQE